MNTDVYAWWAQAADRATNAPYTIVHDGGATTVAVNQQANGSRWNYLGTFAMTPDSNRRVVLSDDANGVVIADAVQFAPAGTLPNNAVWTPSVPSATQYNVYAWWRAGSDRVSSAPYTVYHAGGSSTVLVNQQTNNGMWNLLGAFSLAPGQDHRVMLTDDASGGTYVVADAVRVTRLGAPPPTATWTPALPRRDRYQVYARWQGTTAGYATNAPYTIHHEGGSTTVAVNQQQNSSTWMLLGTFTMAPGQNHRVALADAANGNLTADAVKFVPEPAAKTATWAIAGSQIPQSGSYKVYAKWPAASTHATDVPYTVTHAGGTGTVIVNQRVNGGQWTLLGEFSFDAAGTGYKVELSDSPNGKVAADAVYIVPAGAPSGDAFTWTPAIPSSGTYQVYARWPASSANAGAAQYTVTHAGGTANVTLNQKQNGGSWVPLGSWSFAPGAGHKVTLAAAAEGTTIADALLFVAAGAQPANLLYVHADHLGSPQKLTDASQATVWDGVFDPFGEEVAITGLAAMPMRFPGQYADDETGYSYNYFRDYEPRLGRYVQSDPMGILAGLSIYLYVDARPASHIDPFGLAGHHIVPQAVYNSADLPAETQNVFDKATSGPIPGGHGWSKEHQQYSEAVGDAWNKWIQKNGIDPTKMTPDQARDFLNMVASSKDPRISSFLKSIEKSIGRKVFSKFLKCGTVIFFLIDANEYGLDYATEAAVDDVLWPLNDTEIGMGAGPAY